MATGTKRCKICDVEYPFCKTPSQPGVFRWQDVACCEEHGKQYLAKILASRGEGPAPVAAPAPVAKEVEVVEPEVVTETVEEVQTEEVSAENADKAARRKKSRRKFIAAEELVTETNE